MKEKNKISIITPVYNQVEFIEQTILSVINQDYKNLEYIIIDGGSNDGTLDIIKKYDKHITKWISEPDKGMYDAIHKGFMHSTGDIMAWINSDDILMPNAFKHMNAIFNDLPNVNWVQGLNGFIDLKGQLINSFYPKKFSLLKFLNHEYKFIQQESTFWRRTLWEKAGSEIRRDLKLAGDFELWFRFFKYDKLYTSNLPIGAWRKREGQLSGKQMANYLEEVRLVINEYKQTQSEKKALKKIKNLDIIIAVLKKIKILNTQYFLNKKESYLNLRRIEITYSYNNNKFIVV
ncbi:glycosyltransferase family 2 protein [Flavivirga aquatica]|uniref:glycosyltransferase family 2 protein n=1 Tax=Flavivirga aquatica TaxID=1849968 RepID=UPI0013F4E298|nr:glycosyltransferase family 2 protein [Flavivirga aquatica]